MKVSAHDLFPVHLRVYDFPDDPALNQALLHAARTEPALRSSVTGASVLHRTDPWVAALASRYDAGLRDYLGATWPERTEPFDLERYVFFNYTDGSSFTPVHDHLVEGDLVCIYYAHVAAHTPERVERVDGSYYAMDDGILVVHDPRADARLDRRGVHTKDHFKVYPRPNRLVIQPAHVRHSVTPSVGTERLAVTCTVTVNRPDLFEGYVKGTLDPRG